jgi:hypothetical protein
MFTTQYDMFVIWLILHKSYQELYVSGGDTPAAIQPDVMSPQNIHPPGVLISSNSYRL